MKLLPLALILVAASAFAEPCEYREILGVWEPVSDREPRDDVQSLMAQHHPSPASVVQALGAPAKQLPRKNGVEYQWVYGTSRQIRTCHAGNTTARVSGSFTILVASFSHGRLRSCEVRSMDFSGRDALPDAFALPADVVLQCSAYLRAGA